MLKLPPRRDAKDSGFDFGPFLGKGVDELAALCHAQLVRFINAQDRLLSPATIASMCLAGLPKFLRYTAFLSKEWGRPLSKADIDIDLMRGYVAHLASLEISIGSQKRFYNFIKTILSTLQSRGLIANQALFPQNPFPYVNRKAKGVLPYSLRERKQLAKALSSAINPIFQHNDPELTSELIAYCFLSVALRTGRNLTPLIEMRTDSLREHFKPGMKLLVLHKRRSRRTSSLVVCEPSPIDATIGLLPETVRIIERVMLLTAPLRSSAEAADQDFLWLYRSRALKATGSVNALTPAGIGRAAAKLVSKFGLESDDGGPLTVNVARMRKTFSNRIYEISGSAVVAASAAGHTRRVAEDNYLVPSRESEARWSFMGKLLADELSNGRIGGSFTLTPTGGCNDSRNGQFAPKNGSICTSFLNCFRCREYVVTGDDLFKLFSFYWLVVRERNEISSSRWSRVYSHILRVIERDIVETGISKKLFMKKQVALAKERARVSPHPYWRDRSVLGYGK